MWVLAFIFFFEFGDINTFSFAAPAIRGAWGLSISIIGVITSATFIGMFIGATTGGRIADKIGRKKALILTTLWYSGFSLLNALAWEPIGLFAARLLTGVGLSAMTVIGITYINEIFPASRRGAFQAWILTIGLLGIPVTAYIARFCIPAFPWGWRLVFIWGSLGMLFLLFSNRIEESPRWYESRGRLVEADDVLNRIEEAARREVGTLAEVPNMAETGPQSGCYAQLLARPYRSRTLMLVAVWIFKTLGFYGFMAWVPTLLVAHGFSLVHSLAWSSAMQLGAVPGAMMAVLISDRWQRKWLISIVALLIACCGLIYGLTLRTNIIMIFGFLVAMLIQTFAPLLYAYTAECYPTHIRSSGTGLTYGIGRLANAFGPLLVAFLFGHYGYASVFIYIATCWLLVVIIIGGYGPLTKDASSGPSSGSGQLAPAPAQEESAATNIKHPKPVTT